MQPYEIRRDYPSSLWVIQFRNGTSQIYLVILGLSVQLRQPSQVLKKVGCIESLEKKIKPFFAILTQYLRGINDYDVIMM